MGLSYRFRDKRQYQSKIANFSHPVYFAPRLKGLPLVPLELGTGAWNQKPDGATGSREKFDNIFSRLDTVHQCDGRTDGRTPGDSKDRAYV